MIIKKIIESDMSYIGKFQQEGLSDIVPAFTFYVKHSFCYPIKMMIEQNIIGVGAGISLGKTAWLAHIIVHPEFRNKGIGTVIVNYLCKYLKENGALAISLIATELGLPVYKKTGFIEQMEYVTFEREEILKNTISKNIVAFSNQDTKDVLSLEKKISGEERSILIRTKLLNSYVYKKDNKVLGFYLPELGEGLIMADDPESGIELMKLRNTRFKKGVLPIDNSEGIKFFQVNGFKETKRVKRMVLGEKFEWNPGKLYNRIGGNFG